MAIQDDMQDVQEAVINELITENGITNTLADGQVTETKILNNAVTTNKIANGAVTSAKLGSDVDLTPADGSITPAKLDRAYLESTGGSVSGNLLVGKTVTSQNTAGTQISASSGVRATVDGNVATILNRTTSDGDIALFRKDGSTVGSIKCRSSGGNLQIDTVQSGIDFGGDGYLPMRNGSITDASLDMGSSSFRYKDLWLSGTIILSSVPTSSSGLPSGAIYSDGGTLKIKQ